jgi:hypothetical protein
MCYELNCELYLSFLKKNSFHLSLMLVCLFTKCWDYLFKSEISILWPQHFWKVMISLVSMIHQIFSLQKSSFFLRSDRMVEQSNNRMIEWSNGRMVERSNSRMIIWSYNQMKLTLWLTLFLIRFFNNKRSYFWTNFRTNY